MSEYITQSTIETPLGQMVACATDLGICLLEFHDRKMLNTNLNSLKKRLKLDIHSGDHPFIRLAENEINEYMAGHRKIFEVPIVMTGTPFQEKVWSELLSIPFGHTRSYQYQAVALGNSSAVRAVANANGANKIAIIIPCHRVIGSDGELTGYGGKIWRKQRLLELENPSIQLRLF